MKDLDIYVLTIPRSIQRAEQSIQHLIDHGFPKKQIELVYGYQAPPESTVKIVDKYITRGHREICNLALSKKSENPIMIVEDDIEIHIKMNLYYRVLTALEYINYYDPEWALFCVGHCPCGPTYMFGDGIVRTSRPGMAHCYILNRKVLPYYLQKVPAEKWRRPLAVEKWTCIPMKHKYGLFANAVTQSVIPKEFRRAEWVGKFCIKYGITIVQWIMFFATPIIVSIIVFVIVRHIYRSKFRVTKKYLSIP